MASPTSHGGLRSAAVFALCALFAVLAMGLTLLSSGVYRSTVTGSDANYNQRTALSYLVNQVRRADSWQSVSVEDFEGNSALALYESEGDSTYVTLLYCYDGQLRELYMEKDGGLLPQDGVAILPADRLELAVAGGLIDITVIQTDGTKTSVQLTPRSGVTAEGGSQA